MKNKFRFPALAIAFVMVFGMFAGCTQTQPPATQAPSTQPPSAQNQEPAPGASEENPVAVSEWDFQMISVLTGNVAFAGVPAAWGAEYAVKVINETGGIRGVPVKITKRDSAFDPAKAVSEMSNMVDKSLVVFGPMDGPGADAAGQVAFDAKVPFLAACTTEVVRDKYAPYGISYMTDSEKGAAEAAVKWIKKNEDIRNVVIFYYPADNASTSEYNLAKAALEKEGVNVIGAVEVTAGQLDLGPSVVKAMSLNPDGYLVYLRTEEFVRAIQELKNRGVTEGRRMIGTFSSVSTKLFELAEDGLLDDVYIWNKIDPNYPSDEWQKLVAAYKADNNGDIPSNNTAANFYEAVMAVKEAIETLKLTGDPKKLAAEREMLANYLFNSKEYDFGQGTFKWVDGEKVTAPHFFQLKGTEYVRVD